MFTKDKNEKDEKNEKFKKFKILQQKMLNAIKNRLPMLCVVLLATGAGAATGYAAGRQSAERQVQASEARRAVRPHEPEYKAGQTAITKPQARYLVGTSNGFLAVFYGTSGDSIKEVTTTPTTALPPEEQLRLLEGIRVYTNEELVRVLQDYGS